MAPRTAWRVEISAALCLMVAYPTHADTTVTFIDAGQGDAILIHDDKGHDVLIDAGEGSQAYDYLMAAPPEDLDVVVWTHAHEDHIGGMDEILGAFPMGQIVWNGFDYNSATFFHSPQTPPGSFLRLRMPQTLYLYTS